MLAFIPTFCIPMVLSRRLTPEHFGTYKQAFLVYNTLYAIAQVGMAESLYYFIPGSRERGRSLVANSFLALSLSGAIAAIALVAAGGPVSRWLSSPGLAALMPIVAVCLALSLPAAILEIVLIARGSSRVAAAAYAASDALRAACLVIPALLGGDVAGVMMGAAAFSLIRFVACWPLVAGPSLRSIRADLGLMRNQLAYAAPFASAIVIEIVQMNFHQYVVSARFDPATFAVYSVGCLQIPFVEFVANPICNLMMVGMRGNVRDGDPAAAGALWRAATSRIAWFVLPLVGWLLVAGHDLIVVLFTPKYAGAVPVFRVWTLALGLSVLQTDGVLRVFAQTRFLFFLSLMKLAVTVLSIGPLIAAFGLAGAAASPLLAVGLAKIVSMARIRGLLGVSVSRLLPWGSLGRAAATAGAAALVSIAARGFAPPASVTSIVFAAGAYLATGAGAWAALRWLDRDGRGGLPGTAPPREASL
jgi:O-antigen/teichoic acid export membrane protein